LLALTGIYGIVAQAVVQRRFEIGVRLALGSTPQRVVRLMLQRAVSPVAAGAIVGLVGMVAAAHLLSAMLFETAPFDPATFTAATGLFVLVALIAAFLPARGATKVDPMIALRCE
jgi:ABC-type antimicrobial peptide transport system permease subunit